MKHRAFIVFFSVVLTIHTAVNWYIFSHGWNALPAGSPLRLPFLIVFVILASSFLAARFLQRVWLSPVTVWLDWIGAFWLAAMVYFLMAVIVIDLARLVNVFAPFIPRDPIALQVWKNLAFSVIAGIVTIVVLAGHINARIPRVRRLEIDIAKPAGERKELAVMLVTDIHLGTIMHNRRLTTLVGKINALQPELILLAGDVFDEDIGAVIKQNQGETLRALRAPLGVFAATGNHEYIGGVEPAAAYLEKHGITVLRDRAVVVDDCVVVAGREDRSIGQFTGGRRVSIPEILSGVDRSMPVVMMDHQPAKLEEAQEAGVDLQVSGHTHHGQLWPFGFITRAVYEKSWGYLRKGATQYYVSCGVGTWGPPVRTGNRPEIVMMRLRFSG